MDHEPLHNDLVDFDLRLSNKAKKDRDKPEPGDRKKWNLRKPSGSDVSRSDGPSPSFGLIGPSADSKSKKTLSPTMIFENALSDHDEPSDENVISTPTSHNISHKNTQQSRASPHTSSGNQGTMKTKRKSLTLTVDPTSFMSKPPSIQKPDIHLHTSSPAGRQQSVPRLPETYSSPLPKSSVPDKNKLFNEIPTNSQWQQSGVQQFFIPNNDNNIDMHQEDMLRSRIQSNPETGSRVEAVDVNPNMWQAGQMNQGNWAAFQMPSNDVFVHDAQAWSVSDNAVADSVDISVDGNVTKSSESSRSSNSSESDIEETEENVWKINDEQRAYYFNQFRILQPEGKGVVSGQKARDFFLKSGLTTEVLSRIWNLADLDNDGALDFEEFCIAMHIVVAVRHGLKVPDSLPSYLIPEKYETQTRGVATQLDTISNELSLPDSGKSWAKFSPDGRPTVEIDGKEAQLTGQLGVSTQGVVNHQDQVSQHVSPSGAHAQQVDAHVQSVGQHAMSTSQHVEHARQNTQSAEMTQNVVQQAQQEAVVPKPSPQPVTPVVNQRRVQRTMSDSHSTEESTAPSRKISLGIPRVRGQPKQTNLLDTPHWAILPPPSKFSKDAPEEVGKGGQFVPTGTIIPAYVEDPTKPVGQEKPEQVMARGSDSDSSSSERNDLERARSSSRDIADDSESSPSKDSSENSSRGSQDLVDTGSVPEVTPPAPFTRRSGHSRSSSLDLQKLFNKGSPSTPFQPNPEFPQNGQANFANFDDFDNKTENVSHASENQHRFAHRRSASLDSTHAIFNEPTLPPSVIIEDVNAKENSNPRPEVTASVPRPVPKKKTASLPPPLNRTKKDGTHDSSSDNMIEKEKKISKEPIHFVVKPLTRLEQLHAKIRDLKTKNTTLSRINNELQQELKQMMETRVGLESSLEQLKPFAK